MNITRDVVMDLLPLYLAGEASEDSDLLIQKYMEQDSEFAELIRLSEEGAMPFTAVSPPDNELVVLNKTKRLIEWRSWLLGAALFFSASLFGIKSVGNGVEWLWAGWPLGFALCLMTAVCSWLGYIIIRYRLNHVGV